MNILFEKMRYKNMLSTGNLLTEIDFTSSRNTLIVGENGAGKSTMLDALCFVLFNKPFRKINKPQLINSITRKELVVEIEFRIKGSKFKIIRGMKPAVFEIWKDDELLNQDAANKDYQAHLEKNVLRTSYKTFCQIVILGSASFVPFMQLPAGQRREITEDLLDLQIFTTMNSILKSKASGLDREVMETDKERAVLTQKLNLLRSHAVKMFEDKQKQIDEKSERLNSAVDEEHEARKKLEDYQNTLLTYAESIADKDKISKKDQKLRRLDTELNVKISGLKSEIDFLKNNTTCPTCKQDIDSDFCEHATVEKLDVVKEVSDGLTLLKEEQDVVRTRLTEIEAVARAMQDTTTNVHVIKSKISTLASYCLELQREIEALSKENRDIADESSLKFVESELETIESRRGELTADQNMMSYVGVLLKDSGIKARIIKQYVPIINKLINKYLAALDFFVDFELNENFEETIKARGRDDFSYNSFSEGEKMRIDLAVLFAWRAVSKLRSSINTNLLIMDEVFDGSLDSSGTEEFMKILARLTEDNNVFIISHKTDQLWDRFERVIKFEKVRNFSTMVV